MDYHIYSDESGIEGREAYCIAAGYLASPRKWRKFEKDWAAVLRKYGTPGFHAKEFFPKAKRSRRDEYTGWTIGTCVKYLDALLRVIEDCHLDPVGAAISLTAFYSLSEIDRRLLTGGDVRMLSTDRRIRDKWMTTGAPGKPYYAAASLLLLRSLSRAKSGTPVHFVFDRQDEYEGWMRQAFYEIATGNLLDELPLSGRLGDISYARSDLRLQLQAADLHGYIWNRYLARRGLEQEFLPVAERHINSEAGYLIVGESEHLQNTIASLRRHEGPKYA